MNIISLFNIRKNMERISTSQNIIVTKKWDNNTKSQELMKVLNSVSEKDIDNIWEEIKKDNERRENMHWNIDEITKYIKDNYVKEKEWSFALRRWKNITLSLPAVWEFKGYNAKFFISNSLFAKAIVDRTELIKENLWWITWKWGLQEMYRAVRDFLIAYWIEFENTRSGEENNWWETLVTCLKEILWLDSTYRTKSTNYNGETRTRLNCEWDNFYYETCDWTKEGKLLIKRDD